MTRFVLFAFFSSVVFLIPIAYANGKSQKFEIIKITEQDNGTIVHVGQGAVLELSLPVMPGTGYRWEILSNKADELEQMNETQFIQDERSTNKIGAYETQVYRFVARNVGLTELKLGYKRPWETNSTLIKVFQVTVHIEEQ